MKTIKRFLITAIILFVLKTLMDLIYTNFIGEIPNDNDVLTYCLMCYMWGYATSDIWNFLHESDI